MGNKLQNKAIEVFKRLNREYPDSACSLNHRNPLQLLISTILSAQCTDKQVNKITPALFAKYKTARDFAEADLNELKKLIKPAGFYNNKARTIKETMKIIHEKYNGKIPKTLEELTRLPGVGRKTANVVLGDAFGVPGIVVDTHVKRLSKRIGLTDNNDPVKIEFDLMKVFPRETWIKLGHLMIDHGRKICNARNPKCEICVLKELCNYYLFTRGEKSENRRNNKKTS